MSDTAMATPLDFDYEDPRADPYPTYARLRAQSPVARVRGPRMWNQAYLITRYEDVLSLLKDPRFSTEMHHRFKSADNPFPWWLRMIAQRFNVFGNNMLGMDDPGHARLRNLVQKAFTPALVQNLHSRIEQITEELLDRMQGKREIDLIADFALPLPMTVISEMLGVPEQERMRFRHYAKDIVHFRGGTWGVLRRVLNRGRMVRYFHGLIDYRRKNPDGQLISLLVQAEQAGDRLSAQELVAMVFLLLFAGHETTVNLIGNGMLALLDHPDQLAMLRDRPELVRTAVEELLRFTNPVEHGMPRVTLAEVEIQGVKIPPYSLVLAMLSAANRDPEIFANPETLDITRDPNRHLAFGIGIHYCLGAPLARMEGAIAFNALLRRFPNLQLAVPRDQIRWRPPSLVRGLEALPVRLNG